SRIGTVYNILAYTVGIKFTNCTVSCSSWVGCTNELTEVSHGILFFENHRHTGTTTHKLTKFTEKWTFAVYIVEPTGCVHRESCHLHGKNFKTGILNLASYFADKTFANTIWFENSESTFNSHDKLK